MSNEITEFHLDVPQTELDELNDRLARTRWPDQINGTGWDYGVPLDYVRHLAEYWRTGYDWRAHEARLNALPQFTTTIDGANVYFIHVRSPEPDAIPLILTHGWPGSVVEFLDLIGPLTDPRAHGGDPAEAFDVVIPAIPGYGLSGPTPDTGWDVVRVARAWAELMRRLGYRRFAAHGGDIGSGVTRELGVLKPDGLLGVHVLQVFAFPRGDDDLAALSQEDRERWQGVGAFMDRAGYLNIQSTRPLTLAYGLEDSPAGLLAWNTELYVRFGDTVGVIDRDKFLTNVMMYWLTGTSGSAARIYYEDARSGVGRREDPNAVPTGVAVFPEDFPSIRQFAERANNIVHWTDFDRGGHFAAMEVPDLVLDDIRTFFRTLR